ncbi:MAG: peptide chain release factor N(5)-glutamine methyltransferase [Candidatus Aminicenantes bacterium]|nr:peptide chain release factor N(5)-glutamine methyltransferase [Candidatus Aminicenantes bacterium]
MFSKGRSLLKDLPNPALEAKVLLLKSTTIQEDQFYSFPKNKLSRAEERRFYKLVSKRLTGLPLPYITGVKEFWSIPFRISPGVLIPRPETELIVEKLLELSSRKKETIVDIGTGCGNIAVSLAKELPQAQVVATDKARKALRLAKLNASLQIVPNIIFARGSLFSALKKLRLEWKCDFIVSNPPYVSEEEWPKLNAEIRDHEPKSALVAGKTGLEVINKLVQRAPSYLKPGGYLLVEIGNGQRDKILSFFDFSSVWEEVNFFKDLNGISRVALGKTQSVFLKASLG